MKTNPNVLKLATDELIRMARAGELGITDLWTSVKGARKWVVLLLDPRNHADDVVAEARFQCCCRACPSAQVRLVGDAKVTEHYGAVETVWCGTPSREALDAVLPTCGCLVGITVSGQPRAEGKTRVKTERCPQGRW